MGSIIQMRQTEAERQRTCSGVHGSLGFDAFLLVSKFEKIRTDSRSLKVPESVAAGVAGDGGDTCPGIRLAWHFHLTSSVSCLSLSLPSLFLFSWGLNTMTASLWVTNQLHKKLRRSPPLLQPSLADV